MNLQDKIKAIKMLAEMGLLPQPTAEQAADAAEIVEKRVRELTVSIKRLYGDVPASAQMTSIANCCQNASKAHPSIGITFEAFTTMALWATAFNKTMDEAMVVYKKMLTDYDK